MGNFNNSDFDKILGAAQEKIETAISSANQKISEANRSFEQQLEKQRIELSQKINERDQTVENILDQIEKQKIGHSQEIEEKKATHRQEMDRIESSHVGKMNQLQLKRHKIKMQTMLEQAKQAELRLRIQSIETGTSVAQLKADKDVQLRESELRIQVEQMKNEYITQSDNLKKSGVISEAEHQENLKYAEQWVHDMTHTDKLLNK